MAQASTQHTLADVPDEQAVARLRHAKEQIVGQLSRVIVGMEQVIDELMIAVFSRGTRSWWACRAWRKRCW